MVKIFLLRCVYFFDSRLIHIFIRTSDLKNKLSLPMKELNICVAAVSNRPLMLFAVTRNFTEANEQSMKLATVDISTFSTILLELCKAESSEFSWLVKDSWKMYVCNGREC